jgi:hypothetical protein
MKTLRMNLVKAAILMLPFGLLQAQEKTTQAYWVHEDVVKPGMVIDYENICKELTSNLKKHNIQELNNLLVNTSTNRN